MIKEDLVKNLRLKNISKNLKEKINLIKNNTSVSVHLRRGDYLSSQVKNHIGVCSMDYYVNAIENISIKHKDAVFYIFSDDILWCRQNLKTNKETIFVGNEFKSEEAFEMMKNCRHNIISNSTFSWWAAWLNSNPNKMIIAPKTWYVSNPNKSPAPSEWLKLKS